MFFKVSPQLAINKIFLKGATVEVFIPQMTYFLFILIDKHLWSPCSVQTSVTGKEGVGRGHKIRPCPQSGKQRCIGRNMQHEGGRGLPGVARHLCHGVCVTFQCVLETAGCKIEGMGYLWSQSISSQVINNIMCLLA